MVDLLPLASLTPSRVECAVAPLFNSRAELGAQYHIHSHPTERPTRLFFAAYLDLVFFLLLFRWLTFDYIYMELGSVAVVSR